MMAKKMRRKEGRKHRFWVREIFRQRGQKGVFSNLLHELLLAGDRENLFRLVFFSSIHDYIIVLNTM